MFVDPVSDVWDIISCVAFASQIEVIALKFTKNFQELFEESGQLSRKLVVVSNIGCSLTKSRPNRLLDPKNVREISPGPGIGCGFGLAP